MLQRHSLQGSFYSSKQQIAHTVLHILIISVRGIRWDEIQLPTLVPKIGDGRTGQNKEQGQWTGEGISLVPVRCMSTRQIASPMAAFRRCESRPSLTSWRGARSAGD